MPQASTAISLSSIVARSEAQLSCEVDGETVLMHLDTGAYFGYNEPGSRIWALLETPLPVSELCARLLGDYAGVDAATCEADVLPFLAELAAEGLITIQSPVGA